MRYGSLGQFTSFPFEKAKIRGWSWSWFLVQDKSLRSAFHCNGFQKPICYIATAFIFHLNFLSFSSLTIIIIITTNWTHSLQKTKTKTTFSIFFLNRDATLTLNKLKTIHLIFCTYAGVHCRSGRLILSCKTLWGLVSFFSFSIIYHLLCFCLYVQLQHWFQFYIQANETHFQIREKKN